MLDSEDAERSDLRLYGELRARRKELGLTQATLAARLGIRQNLVSDWESGRRNPSLENIYRWAAALGRSVALVNGSQVTKALDHAALAIWLHGDWKWLTGKMSSDEREALADAVDRARAEFNCDDVRKPLTHHRWWRDVR